MIELVEWEPSHNNTTRVKWLVKVFAAIDAAIESLVNAEEIKKIKWNIAILQEATILQKQKIDELARYAGLTATQVRLHYTQIYRLLRVEHGVKEIIDVSNFYTSYHVNMAQTIISHLQILVISIGAMAM